MHWGFLQLLSALTKAQTFSSEFFTQVSGLRSDNHRFGNVNLVISGWHWYQFVKTDSFHLLYYLWAVKVKI